MSQPRLPPPDPEPCLVRLRSSSQKGGTRVAEDVTTFEEHCRRVRSPDGYRPSSCPRCHGGPLHVHDYRERQLRADPTSLVATIVRHVCISCSAIWQTLPVFIARHLWRTWGVVERVVTASGSPERIPASCPWPRVPARTRQRWEARWRAGVQFLVQVLAASGSAAWSHLAAMLDAVTQVGDLVAAHAQATSTPMGLRLAAASALLFRLQAKVRLM